APPRRHAWTSAPAGDGVFPPRSRASCWLPSSTQRGPCSPTGGHFESGSRLHEHEGRGALPLRITYQPGRAHLAFGRTTIAIIDHDGVAFHPPGPVFLFRSGRMVLVKGRHRGLQLTLAASLQMECDLHLVDHAEADPCHRLLIRG